MAAGDGQIVKIALAPNEAVAAMWREMLQAEGILVLVRVGGPGLAYFTPALCEHHLYVRADQAARARQVLDDYAAAPDEIVMDDDPEQP